MVTMTEVKTTAKSVIDELGEFEDVQITLNMSKEVYELFKKGLSNVEILGTDGYNDHGDTAQVYLYMG